MEMNNERLRRFAEGKSKYFQIRNGEETVVKYLSVEIVPNHWDGGKTECARYTFEVDGKIKLWERVSRDLARQIMQISKGTLIKIRREGEKNQTRYFITEVTI